MVQQAELSPNVPDVAPEYVDNGGRDVSVDDTVPSSWPDEGGDTAPAPDPVDLECLHTLNAELMPETAPEATGAAAPVDGHREGECVPNIPDVQPAVVPADALRRESPAPEAPTADAAAKATPAWLRWGNVFFALVAAAFGALLISQIISSVALAATLPTWAQYLLLIPFLACAAVVVVGIVEFVRAWYRLREVRQVDAAALAELRRRAQTRSDGIAHVRDARAALEDYVRDYPLAGEAIRGLREAGVDAETVETLARERGYLLSRSTDSHSWLDEFGDLFQRRLDKAAAARVRIWSLKAAGCVIASPLPLLDAVLVLGICTKMIRDLCRIYNVRSTKAGTLLILHRAIVAAFIAGVAGSAADSVGDAASEELTGIFGETALGAMGAGVARAVAPKLGEGTINAFFVHRLGRAVIGLLQPLKQ